MVLRALEMQIERQILSQNKSETEPQMEVNELHDWSVEEGKKNQQRKWQIKCRSKSFSIKRIRSLTTNWKSRSEQNKKSYVTDYYTTKCIITHS